MDDYQPTDDEIELLLGGRAAGNEPAELVELIEILGGRHLNLPPVVPDVALREFLSNSVADRRAMTTTLAGKERSPVKKLAAGVGAVAATTAGKLVVATAVAATTVGGATAAGVIDLSGNKPDDLPAVVAEVSERPAVVVDVETGPNDGAGQEHRSENHGGDISGLATEAEDHGCEFGRDMAAAASVEADDQRDDDDREMPECKQPDDTDADPFDDGRGQGEPAEPEDRGKPEDPGPAVTIPEDPGKPEDPGPAVTIPEDPGRPEEPGKPGSLGSP